MQVEVGDEGPDRPDVAEPVVPDTPYRYMTLAAARALECNGCGDCCDSRRSDGFWTWGSLPEGQYAEHCDGVPLIIPMERVDGLWSDRRYESSDAGESTPTRFRCSAFRPDSDGGGSCGRHEAWRPARCGEFPTGGEAVEAELAARGYVLLQTAAFPRCTWYRVVVVAGAHPRLVTCRSPPVSAPESGPQRLPDQQPVLTYWTVVQPR